MPVLVLVFFFAAPYWLNERIRSSIIERVNKSTNLSMVEKDRRVSQFSTVDFAKICRDNPPGYERLRAGLEATGAAASFQRIHWGFVLSLILTGVILAAVCSMLILNGMAGRSKEALIRCYRLGWRIAVIAAIIEVILLVPLLTYGLYEFTVLLADRYSPQLLLAIAVGGLAALYRSISVLVKEVPLEFSEPLSKSITPEEAPQMWEAARLAAARLGTAPPDHIVIGMQPNFYVTELAVKHDAGRVEGRILFLSYPLLKELSEEDTLSIIGHELGHFIGEDTVLTRQFYPIRMKAHATMMALAGAGLAGITSFQFLNFFGWCFGKTERDASRSRELLADRKAADLTSSKIAARALVRFHVLIEAWKRALDDMVHDRNQSLSDISLRQIICQKLMSESDFWSRLFERKLQHPLDSHPALHVRLEALGETIDIDQAKAIASEEFQSAYAKWFGNGEELFASITSKAETIVEQLRMKSEVEAADAGTKEGRELLERHFPALKWHSGAVRFWFAMGFIGLVVAGCITASVMIDDRAIQTVFGCVALCGMLPAVIVWRRHHKAELSLTIDGMAHSGWNRTLSFKDVGSISMNPNNHLTLHLKEKQEPFWKMSIQAITRKKVGVSLNGFKENPRLIAHTIHRYILRQIDPSQSKPSGAE